MFYRRPSEKLIIACTIKFLRGDSLDFIQSISRERLQLQMVPEDNVKVIGRGQGNA